MTEPQIDDIYVRIARKITGTEKSEILPKILKVMLTPVQAELADTFPGVSEELATKLGRDLESVNKDLQYIGAIGIGTPSARSGKWNLPRNWMRFFDKVGTHHKKFLASLGPEYIRLWNELNEEQSYTTYSELVKIRFRVMPAYYAIKDNPELQVWESMEGLFSMAEKIAVVPCTCLLCNREKSCNMHTDEVCFPLNRDAEYSVETGSGRYVTVEEAMKITEHCERLGLLHIKPNVRGIVGLLCNAHADCCELMRPFYEYGNNDPQWIVPSRYLAVVNDELCDGCRLCATCSFGVISMMRNSEGKLKAVVDAGKCYGSGACKLKCPSGAITMKCVRPEEWVPRGLVMREGESRDGPLYEKYAEL
ncbi:ATP-binding protein [Chloroflexota bacterium]